MSKLKLGSLGSKVELPKLKLPKKQKIEVPAPSFPVKIVYVWFLVFISMCIYTVAWFACGLLVFPFISAVQSTMSTDSSVDTIVTFIKACFLYHPIVALLSWFAYGIINSFRRDEQSWRTQ
jgi:sterol desaturase/sphingolipid hydroxylase (fatty acid hydroxylase superfamily)